MAKRNRRRPEPVGPAADAAPVPGDIEPGANETGPAEPAEAAGGTLPHEPSGETCRVHHLDGQGPCQRCRHCGLKFRPDEMGGPCAARG